MKNRLEVMMLRKENKEFAMNEDYERILKGIKHDPLMEVYSSEYVNEMIEFFSDKEEYEKCSELVKYKEERFNHDKNYIKLDGYRTI